MDATHLEGAADTETANCARLICRIDVREAMIEKVGAQRSPFIRLLPKEPEQNPSLRRVRFREQAVDQLVLQSLQPSGFRPRQTRQAPQGIYAQPFIGRFRQAVKTLHVVPLLQRPADDRVYIRPIDSPAEQFRDGRIRIYTSLFFEQGAAGPAD